MDSRTDSMSNEGERATITSKPPGQSRDQEFFAGEGSIIHFNILEMSKCLHCQQVNAAIIPRSITLYSYITRSNKHVTSL